MAKLKIYVSPAPVLKKVAEPVEKVDEQIVKLMDDMLETMYGADGIGLAAPQVGVSKRVIVLDVAPAAQTSDEQAEEKGKGEPLQMANPEIIWESDDHAVYNEGCLSVPEQYAEVERPARVRVRYLDRNNNQQELEADHLLATCIQHEIDHLNGILFVDHLSSLKRSMLLRKLKKLMRGSDTISVE